MDQQKGRGELIIPLIFRINRADYSSIPLLKSDVFGGYGEVNGYANKVELSVTPEDKDIPIKTLNFRGLSFIQTGDRIRAYVPKYKIEKGKDTGMILGGEEIYEELYFERDFNSEETITRFEKIDLEGKILASFQIQ